ncbi:hypothetical protein [uncultured Roseobacter sp.]|uniref:hypothetical protein n=1 Tax=uncultured Roseobacter sp. TaxID=114847 RepID=UPI00260389E8|nr:hypothetical protein [uncultured Roseobacter sp.]
MSARRVLFAGLTLLWCGAAAAGQKTYSGDEAAALRCANTVAFTAIVLASTDRIGRFERNVMLGISANILTEYVSGTRGQKKRALAQIRDRRSVLETLSDFQRLAERCLRRFPLN